MSTHYSQLKDTLSSFLQYQLTTYEVAFGNSAGSTPFAIAINSFIPFKCEYYSNDFKIGKACFLNLEAPIKILIKGFRGW